EWTDIARGHRVLAVREDEILRVDRKTQALVHAIVDAKNVAVEIVRILADFRVRLEVLEPSEELKRRMAKLDVTEHVPTLLFRPIRPQQRLGDVVHVGVHRRPQSELVQRTAAREEVPRAESIAPEIVLERDV